MQHKRHPEMIDDFFIEGARQAKITMHGTVNQRSNHILRLCALVRVTGFAVYIPQDIKLAVIDGRVELVQSINVAWL